MVTFSKMVRVFAAPAFQAYPDFKSIIRDFKSYKQHNNSHFKTFKFGKDVTYNRPQSALDAELSHVHIVSLTSSKNTSDRFLVYSRGFSQPDCYIVLAIFEPNAHSISRNNLIMSQIAQIAENFRQQY